MTFQDTTKVKQGLIFKGSPKTWVLAPALSRSISHLTRISSSSTVNWTLGPSVSRDSEGSCARIRPAGRPTWLGPRHSQQTPGSSDPSAPLTAGKRPRPRSNPPAPSRDSGPCPRPLITCAPHSPGRNRSPGRSRTHPPLQEPGSSSHRQVQLSPKPIG